MTDRPKSAATKPKQVSVIGYYEMDKNIGEGNFAKVRLAKHMITKQEVAIKIIDKNKLDKSTSKKLFREVRIMRLLNHKNIVKLYEVIDTPDELYLVMEYLSGGEIFDYLVAHGRMKEKDARRHFRQIIGAVAYCHNLCVIHRDLKAENILLDENMNVKIADFGFSNQFSPGQKLNTWCGSPPYAAPELFQGKEYSGPEVDIWSLGVVLYVFVCGSLPFDGSNLSKLRARVIAGKFQIPFYMSPDCEKLIKKMLVIDPTKRATIDQIMHDKWYMEGCENEPPQIISTTPVQLSPEMHNLVIEELVELGLDKEAVLKSLAEGEYNSLTATYYLVADRRVNQPNVPIKQALASSPAKEKPKTASKGTVLETFDEEDSNSDTVPARQKAATTTPNAIPKTESPTELPVPAPTGPPKVVAGRRRATVNSAPTNFAPDFKVEEEESAGIGELPAVKTGRTPADSKNQAIKTANEIKTIVANQGNTPALPSETPSALPPIQTIRTRAYTMATDRKTTDEEVISIDQVKAHLDDEGAGPRTARFTFSVSTTSTKEPQAVFDIVKKTLEAANVQVQVAGLVATAKLNDIEFEIEVCKLPNLDVVGLRCKRLAGGAWDYKEILSGLISQMNL